MAGGIAAVAVVRSTKSIDRGSMIIPLSASIRRPEAPLFDGYMIVLYNYGGKLWYVLEESGWRRHDGRAGPSPPSRAG